ncbi:hypothetical protein [Polyangium fumosum]|uniref:Uncharacterized protein n=1 Tax=Polyangium fumosum TaxID=889272 RepID=A0A4U1J088_9BACT|nr:hypothetical protein [Polyangium fumosum]TKC99771.1 hypothetical protein E8A74_36625 [Polyangium fumosum]
MIARASRFGRLVFDRDAIVRAALRAYVETILARVDPFKRHRFAVSDGGNWEGDLRRGAFYNDDGCGDYEVVAWTESGVVGLAFHMGFGPIEQLGLSLDAVTGGPDDVRGAVPGLPAELEPAFVRAVGILPTGEAHDNGVVYGEKLAGVGFWLYGDRVAGTLFDDPSACGANRLAAWGLLKGNRLPLACSGRVEPFEADQPRAVPIHAIVDAVTARALRGPTELTPDEIETLLGAPPRPETQLFTRQLQKVGITWPGSPEIPAVPT